MAHVGDAWCVVDVIHSVKINNMALLVHQRGTHHGRMRNFVLTANLHCWSIVNCTARSVLWSESQRYQTKRFLPCSPKGSISSSAPIDHQDRQLITGLCILMRSYYARTAWRSLVKTSRRIDHDCRFSTGLKPVERSTVLLSEGIPWWFFVLGYCPSSNSLCTKHDIFSSRK